MGGLIILSSLEVLFKGGGGYFSGFLGLVIDLMTYNYFYNANSLIETLSTK